MFFYILRLNVIPVNNMSTKRLYKIGITENITRRLEDHKTGLVGGYEIVNIIEHDYELMTIESNFKSKHLPYHGREIFLLDEEDLIIVGVGNIITNTILDKIRPGLCNICNKAAQSLLFHKCKKSRVIEKPIKSEASNEEVRTSVDIDSKSEIRLTVDSTSRLDKVRYLTLSQEALKLGIINHDIYEMIAQYNQVE
jgi:hypothetical protein